MTSDTVAGADGCPGGWVVVTAELAGGRCRRLEASFASDLAAHIGMTRTGALRALAIDMPIGLLDEHPRRADVEARRVLGPRRSSVFPAPVIAALDASDYADACERSRRSCGKALSRQAWNLMPKIRELDAAITPGDQAAVVEAHPECAFLRLHGDRPLPHPKRNETGRRLRRRLVEEAEWFDPAELVSLLDPMPPAVRAAPLADLLDAVALVATARHVALGTDRRLGAAPRPQVDRRGRRAEIVW